MNKLNISIERLIFLPLFLFFLLINTNVISQTYPGWYLVSLTDKNNTPFDISNPLEYISQKAIDRRGANNIKIDSTDLPINPSYIDSIEQYGLSVYHKTKWLNAVLIKIDSLSQITQLNSISFVDSIAYMAPYIEAVFKKAVKSNSVNTANTLSPTDQFPSEYKATKNRINMVELGPFIDDDYNGKGIHIAVFDNGFNNVNNMEAFSQLFADNRVIMGKNFTNNGVNIYSGGSHGTAVLSTMAGHVYGEFEGSAIGASYYLFKTEDNRYEYPIEEANWLFAAECADSAGADIITASLVYSTFNDASLNHTKQQLDGKTAIVSIAAHMASEKGILVFNAAGNEGGGSWQKICFPSDADGIFTIGAVDKDENHASFSSTGYSADGRVKPDLVAEGMGTPIIGTSGKISNANGTSFSTPFMAGATATFLQANPSIKYRDVYNAIIQSASKYNKPDSTLGYGIPNFYFASVLLNNNTTVDNSDDELFSILPNPFENSFHILYTSADSQQIDISIFDISGKVVYENHNFTCHKGNNLIQIEHLNDLKSGIYIVQIYDGEKAISKKLIKEK
ncbi:MAG: S8 family peptidase [Bacteroidales bacterium]|nr:S8 family peptidase [Bacteroidales bacterium]